MVPGYSGTSWSGWMGLGGLVASGTGPAACSMERRSSRRLRTRTGQGPVSKDVDRLVVAGWQSLSGILASSPAATPPASGMIDVCVRGTDNVLYQKTYNGVWSGWTSADGI